MKINYKLKVNKQDFYNYLIHSLELEIYNHTNQSFQRENLHPGFIYNKKIKDKYNHLIEANIEIIEINENELKTKLELENNSHIMSYKFIDDVLVYEEELRSNKKLLDLNNKFMSYIFHHKLKKQILKRFKNIENYIEGNQL